MIAYGADREALMARFRDYLRDFGDTDDDVNRKVDDCIAG
jgi:hypothetical protein